MTELPAAGTQAKKTLAAIGALVGTLDREKQIVKDAFARTFTTYASPQNQALFRELFSANKKEVGR